MGPEPRPHWSPLGIYFKFSDEHDRPQFDRAQFVPSIYLIASSIDTVESINYY